MLVINLTKEIVMKLTHLEGIKTIKRRSLHRFFIKREPFSIFLSVLLVEKIMAKVNAFMLPDGEADLNFQKGEL